MSPKYCLSQHTVWLMESLFRSMAIYDIKPYPLSWWGILYTSAKLCCGLDESMLYLHDEGSIDYNMMIIWFYQIFIWWRQFDNRCHLLSLMFYLTLLGFRFYDYQGLDYGNIRPDTDINRDITWLHKIMGTLKLAHCLINVTLFENQRQNSLVML